MATKNLKYSLISDIPSPVVDGYSITNISSLAIDGTTLYVLKTCGQDVYSEYPISIYKITTFNTNPKISKLNITKNGKTANKVAYHANSITYGIKKDASVGYLFVATMNAIDKPQLLMTTRKGEIKKEIYYKKNGVNTAFSCIDFMGTNSNNKYKFIVGYRSDTCHRAYDVVTLSGSILEYSGITFYSQELPESYISNDIYYKNKNFYNTFYFMTGDKILKNIIYNYNLSSIKNGMILNPSNTYKVNASKNHDKRFEVEGLIIYNSLKYIVANCNSSIKQYNKDGLFKLIEK